MTRDPAQSIIRTYYGIVGLQTFSASLIWAVNTLFLLGAGLDIAQAFLVNATATAAIVIFEIPTGVVADLRGRRASLVLSALCLALSSLIYVLAADWGANLLLFHTGSLLLGLGTTFYSGAVEAWLVDALNAAGHTEPLSRVLARAEIFAGVTTLAGTVSGGFLASVNLSLPYIVRVVLLFLLLAVAGLRMHEKKTYSGGRDGTEVRDLAAFFASFWGRHQRARALILVGFVQFIFLEWAFHAWQPYLLDLLGRDAPWVAGLVGALITVATLFGNVIANWAGERRARAALWIATVMTGFGGTAVGAAENFSGSAFFLATAALLTLSAAVGVSGPLKQARLHALIPAEQRATVLSLDSLVRNGGGVAGQGALGFLARSQGIALGYLVGGMASLVALPLLRASEREPGPVSD